MDENLTTTNQLAVFRRRFGFSQETVARILGRSARYIQRLEAEAQTPDLQTAFGLALLYRTPLDTLFASCYRNALERIGRTVAGDVSGTLPSATAKSTGEHRPRRILGIDPSNQALGLAIIESGQLIYSAVRYLSNASPLGGRLRVAGLGYVKQMMRAFRPDVVVTPDVSSRSPEAQAFCRQLQRLAAPGRLRFVSLNMTAVRQTLQLDNRANLHQLAQRIADLFPEMRLRVPPPRKLYDHQNLQMARFKAIALAVASSRVDEAGSDQLQAA